MNCSDIKEKLQAFLSDGLVEDEYKAYRSHINTCDKCKTYVRSIGSLSNQLWKLGRIRVPEDLASTVLYKLAHSGKKSPSQGLMVSKKYAIGGFLVLLLVGLLLGIHYLKTRENSPFTGEVSPAKVEVTDNQQVPADTVKPLLSEEYKTSMEDVVVFGRDEDFLEQPAEQDVLEEKISNVNETEVYANEAAAVRALPLHWHFRYSGNEQRARLLDALYSAGIALEYQKDGMVVFEAAGKEVEKVLEQMIFISQGTPSSLLDFTPSFPTLPDEKYKVSFYLEGPGGSFLHWHVTLPAPVKKSVFLDMLKEFSVSMLFESDRLIVFSVPDTNLDALRIRIQAMRISFSEYGSKAHGMNDLISGPIRISLYFTD
ncbi:MAG: zf-HC2 domain-containing protein [Candidatus Omnitrophica bacterium]|nr:zf-HC2 domain-containing protein [Candidatus Omnitrophota bacterium]